MSIQIINELGSVIESYVEKQMAIPKTIIARVLTPPPMISIEYNGLTIYDDQIFINNMLLPEYNRTYRVDGTTQARTQTMSIVADNSTSTAPAGEGPHTHGVPTIDAEGTIETTDGTFQESGTQWFTSTLIPGQRVLCHVVGDFYVIAFSITEGGRTSEQGA